MIWFITANKDVGVHTELPLGCEQIILEMNTTRKYCRVLSMIHGENWREKTPLIINTINQLV